MPELPDIAAYIAALEPRVLGQTLQKVRIQSAFLLRTVQPPISAAEGRTVQELQRIGAGARDVTAILQAMKEAGALEAELEVL